eukprot:4669631-Pleurochrysis_carterae.AAC.1
MEALGITWTPLDGATGESATQPAALEGAAAAGTTYIDGIRALRAPGGDEAATWARAGLLCTVGLLYSLDGAHVPARDIAQFVAAAGGNLAAEGA